MTWLEEILDRMIRYVKHYKLQVLTGGGIALLGVMLLMFFLTNEEAVQVTSGFVMTENLGFENEGQNPLELNYFEDVNSVAKKYYDRLAESSDFVDSYDEVAVYTKRGRYEGTYVAFVQYQMKIPGVYTKVPGLETLYIYEDSEQSLCISTEIQTKQQEEVVSAVLPHQDVQALLLRVQEEYQAAVASDTMLEQSLNELQAAYKEESD